MTLTDDRLDDLTTRFASGALVMSESPELWANPHAFYRHLRSSAPMLDVPSLNEVILTRRADCEPVRVERVAPFSGFR